MDAEGYAAVYTEDGSFGSGSRGETGRTALAKMVADLKKGRDERIGKGEKPAPMYHVIANHQITFTGPNEARYDSYWMTVFGAVRQDTPSRRSKPYSRKASNGARRAARRAGSQHESRPADATATVTATNTTGSVGVTE